MTDKDRLSSFQEDFGSLIEAGFVAVKQLDEVNAARLFQAAEVLQPKSAIPKVGMGWIALNKLELDAAEEQLKMALKLDPEQQLARAFLGIAYLMDDKKRPEGEKLLKEASENTDDPTVSNLVEVSMAWAKSDLKQKKPPFLSGGK